MRKLYFKATTSISDQYNVLHVFKDDTISKHGHEGNETFATQLDLYQSNSMVPRCYCSKMT